MSWTFNSLAELHALVTQLNNNNNSNSNINSLHIGEINDELPSVIRQSVINTITNKPITYTSSVGLLKIKRTNF